MVTLSLGGALLVRLRAHYAGLDLAIVRAIVQAQHGSVRAQNNRGGGASFRVVLPRAKG